MSECPKCGAGKKSHYLRESLVFGCKSSTYKGKFEQSKGCRIAELEAENKRLYGIIEDAVDATVSADSAVEKIARLLIEGEK